MEFSSSDELDVDAMIHELTGFASAGRKFANLRESAMVQLCQQTRNILATEPMVLRIEPPLVICGDIHGQLSDLLRHFEATGAPSTTTHLFLGDYVDRGKHSLETMCLLLALKVKFPSKVYLLRGNHECASVNRIYGFYDDCKRRFGIKLWKTFTDLFMWLPVAAVVANRIFCVHGGLSPDMQSLDVLAKVTRPIDISAEETPTLSDVLWSDPSNDITGWGVNDRGVGYSFGPDVVDGFLKRHSFDLICRAHQVVEDGYEFFANRRLVTIFSAPNYCGEFDNAGAVLHISAALVCSFSILKPGAKVVAKSSTTPTTVAALKAK